MCEESMKMGEAPVKMPENAKELRIDLQSVYYQLRKGEIGLREAKQAANVAGKIVSLAKAQLDYNAMTGSKNKIDFFEC